MFTWRSDHYRDNQLTTGLMGLASSSEREFEHRDRHTARRDKGKGGCVQAKGV